MESGFGAMRFRERWAIINTELYYSLMKESGKTKAKLVTKIVLLAEEFRRKWTATERFSELHRK